VAAVAAVAADIVNKVAVTAINDPLELKF